MRCRCQLSKVNANPLFGAVLYKGNASAGHCISPGVLFTCQVLHLELHAVQMRPCRCQAQKGAKRLGCAEKLVEARFCAGVVAGAGQDKPCVARAEQLPSALG